MTLPRYILQDWLVDWEWWTIHVIPEFLEAPSRALLEKVEAYFNVRYEDDARWRQARILESWQFILNHIQSLIADETVGLHPSRTLNLHPDLPTVLWFYFKDEGRSKGIRPVNFTPNDLESFAQRIRGHRLSR
jgi:hypothetical protein